MSGAGRAREVWAGQRQASVGGGGGERPLPTALSPLHAADHAPDNWACPICRMVCVPDSVVNARSSLPAAAIGLQFWPPPTAPAAAAGPLAGVACFLDVAATAVAEEGSCSACRPAASAAARRLLLRAADVVLPAGAAATAASLMAAAGLRRLLRPGSGASPLATLALLAATLLLGGLPLAHFLRAGLCCLCALSAAISRLLSSPVGDCRGAVESGLARWLIAMEVAGSYAAAALALYERRSDCWARLGTCVRRGERCAALAGALLPLYLSAFLMAACTLALAFAMILALILASLLS